MLVVSSAKMTESLNLGTLNLKFGMFECSHESHESCESHDSASHESSLGHAEQLLFSCVSSKMIVCNAVICQMLMLILGTCFCFHV